MPRYLYRLAILMLLALSATAHASKFMFGEQDSIRMVAPTTLSGPGNTRLFLAHRVTMKAFLLPYTITDNGYVFGISGESKQYINLPTGAELRAIQAGGYLPKPLPPTELSWFDYLMGYSLWIALFAIFVLPWLKKRLLDRA